MLDFGSGLGTAVWCVHAWDISTVMTEQFRAGHELWRESLFEIQTVDTSSEMGEMAHRLRTGGEEEEEGGGERHESIPGVYFRQFLPTSNNTMVKKVMVARSCERFAGLIISMIW